MSPKTKREMVEVLGERYRKGSKRQKGMILNEFCETFGYNRKYAIWLLGRSRRRRRWKQPRRGRRRVYGAEVVAALVVIWEGAGFPWSVRLKAAIPLWLPWLRKQHRLSPQIERALLKVSARTIDRLLGPHKARLKRRLYGRTKPGTLLKHQIPIKTHAWDVTEPGYGEVDLVSHSGNNASGDFLHSLNLTDIDSTWVETRAVMGKSQTFVCQALDDIARALPFRLKGLDSDNGSEFINYHLLAYCRKNRIELTRGRPYKKDDNAHVEQKNWTHVRRLLGWDRYDSPEALSLMNDLYTHELRLMMNLFQPSVRLKDKRRVGSRLCRTYDMAQTPLDRLASSGKGDAKRVADLIKLRARLNPFGLSSAIDHKLGRLYRLASSHLADPQLTAEAS